MGDKASTWIQIRNTECAYRITVILSSMICEHRNQCHSAKKIACHVFEFIEFIIISFYSLRKIKRMMDTLDSTGAGEAVAVVERKIRVIIERVRAIINTVPFSLSKLLESWLLNRLNLVPTSNSVAYVSPREKLYGRKINVDKELKHGFGDYVQVHTDSVDNSTKPDHRQQ